ncbi:MAG: NADH-quinone oxidoreductase subunit NuoN [Azospirillum sp.]|nr:NADH-quinone oxidoreductase subunit NuoN [Azospirillum sp.]
MVELPAFLPALPELFLAVSTMALLMFGVFGSDGTARLVGQIAVVVLLCTGLLVIGHGTERAVTFNGMFVMDGFGAYMKVLVLIGSALSIILAQGYAEREHMNRFELPVLMLFATLGMLLMVSANDLISLYVGLETQSLALYVVAAFRRDHAKSSEAGLKYFVLGALSSGLLLYGASLIYGFGGTTQFDRIAGLIAASPTPPVGVVVGMVFAVAGLAFKISAVPFHMWTPDVYEGAPTPVTAFFAAAPKVAAVALILRLLDGPFGHMVEQWSQVIFALSLASMVLGSFAAIQQTNIKRLMAYSSIANMGFALLGLAAGTEQGTRGVVVYMTIYMVMTIGTFAVILCMKQHGRMVEDIRQLAGLSRSHPLMALGTAIFMFSLAGIPPLAGFFGKLYVFLAVIEAAAKHSELYILAVFGVLSSVVGAFYYLRVVKLIYFDDPIETFDRQSDDSIAAVLVGTGLFTMFFFAFPVPVLNGAAAAAAALFTG